MNSSIIILHNMLLFFICNMTFTLTNTSDENNIVTSTEIITAKNISVPDNGYKVDNLKNEFSVDSRVLEPSVDVDLNMDVVNDDVQKKYKEPEPSIIAEQFEVPKEMLSNESPMVLSLSENSSIEPEKLVDTLTAIINQKEENRTESASVEVETIIHNISQPSSNLQQEQDTVTVQTYTNVEKNLTESKNEDIPSFSEWAQKRLEEVEKSEQINSSSKGQMANGKGLTAKLRWKNYASLDCGAKVIAANPESVSPGAILSPSSDEYKLNPCTSRIWFVVELCEAIQIKRIDLANYELFSSSPKDFSVSVSDRYPTRDWSVVGKFTAKDERDIQSFDLDTDIFGKYIKVDIKSHYGSEHYCPISLFRAYGTSVFEVLQKEDPAHVSPIDDDDDDDDNATDDNGVDNSDIADDDNHIVSAEKKNENSQKNLFSSATDAVISIVKRAAEVLGNKVNNQTTKEKNKEIMKSFHFIDTCTTLSHMIFCKNCDDKFFEQIYELISCKGVQIKQLVEIPLIYKALSNSLICANFDHGLNIVNSFNSSTADCVIAFFPLKYVGAMCNEISIIENRGVLNSSQQFSNTTGNLTNEQIFMINIQRTHLNDTDSEVTKLKNVNEIRSSASPFVNGSNEFTISNVSNITNASHIKPTKALTMDSEISGTDANLTITKSVELNQADGEISSVETMDTFSSKNYFEGSIESTTDMDVVTEGMDVLDDHLEHFISEFNADYTQNPSISPSSTTNSPQAQKESIFLRLSNRIKTLERNMSLSSQYLEELSKRYKKQVEEMQNLLEKTVMSLREESLKKDLRNKQLEDRLNNLTALIESLIDERRNWFLTTFWFICGVVSICGFYFFCGKSTTCIKSSRNSEETSEVLYHKPINAVNHNVLEKKKRRPSDQALKILYHSNSTNEEKSKSIQRQRKKKKKHVLKKSNSISNIGDEKSQTKDFSDWVDNSHQVIEDIHFVLDESDHSALESYPLQNEIHKDESPTLIQSPFNLKFNTYSKEFNENDVITGKTNLGNSDSKGANSNILEPIKKEKKSFKRLFKKVF